MVYSIFLRPAQGGFDVEKFRKWLEGQPAVLPDPFDGGTYMVCTSPAVVEYTRMLRLESSSSFPYCVLIILTPEEINVVQECGNALSLRIAREFVKTVIEETGCEVLDEYSKSWTEQVRREGVGVLYPPDLS
jgi:hypothetical protein